MTSDPALLSACALLARYRDGSLSPVEATTAALARIERHNPAFNAFSLVDPDSALADARASERRWWRGAPLGRLDGVPTAVKDLILTRGWPTLRGSKAVPCRDPRSRPPFRPVGRRHGGAGA